MASEDYYSNSTIYKVLNLFSAKDLSDLLNNFGIFERYKPNNRKEAIKRIIDVSDCDLPSVIMNMDYNHLNTVQKALNNLDGGSKYYKQQLLIKYFNEKALVAASNDKLIGKYIDEGVIEKLSKVIATHVEKHKTTKEQRELLIELNVELNLLKKVNPSNEYYLRIYDYIFSQLYGFNISVTPAFISIDFVGSLNPVEEAFRGNTENIYFTCLSYVVTKDGEITGEPIKIEYCSKVEISRKVLL